MWKEFREFALRGNVLDLAIAVIIGTAFGNIVNSLVNDLMMPVFGFIAGGIDLKNLQLAYGDVVISYGAFLQTVVDFFIIAVSIFLFVKLLNRFKRKQKAEEEAQAPEESKEVLLLAEIRDLLKEK